MTQTEIERRPWQELLEWPGSFLGMGGYRWGSCKLIDEDEEVVLLVDLPGAKKEDITLRHQDGHVQIKAVRSADWGTGSEEQRFMRRSISLPEINPGTLKAHLENGVLEIRAERGELTEEIEIN